MSHVIIMLSMLRRLGGLKRSPQLPRCQALVRKKHFRPAWKVFGITLREVKQLRYKVRCRQLAVYDGYCSHHASLRRIVRIMEAKDGS